MEWADHADNGLDSLTAGAGGLRPVRFNTPEPWLMRLAPWLPWREDPADPTHRTKLLNYAPFASIMWSFFLQPGVGAGNSVPVHDYILAPSQCGEVLQVFKAAGFAHNGSSFASLAIAIQSFATYQRFPESLLDTSRHLQ